MTNHLIHIFAAISLFFSTCTMVQAQTASARVMVYGIHQGSNIIYYYKIINTGDVALHDYVIGTTFDSELGYEIPQLERLPLGWAYGRESETGTAITLASSSTSQPPYWTSHIYGQEEIDYYYLEWKTTPDGQAYAIPPGQSLAGFSVSVPLYDPNEFPPDYYNAGVSEPGWKENDMYLTSGFKVISWDTQKNDIQNYWGKLEIEDTTPPQLTVKLSPDTLHPNKKYVPITATISASDDHDPQPAVKLLSITANEPIEADDIKAGPLFTDIRQFQLKADHDGKSHVGRIYTVTYFATDGSGNQTEATATVTVPHDRRKHEESRDKDEKKNKDKKERGR